MSTVKIMILKRYRYRPVTVPLPSRYRPVTVPLPFWALRYRPLPFSGQRYTTLHQRYRPLQTVTDRYRILPLLALQALQALPIVI